MGHYWKDAGYAGYLSAMAPLFAHFADLDIFSQRIFQPIEDFIVPMTINTSTVDTVLPLSKTYFDLDSIVQSRETNKITNQAAEKL